MKRSWMTFTLVAASLVVSITSNANAEKKKHEKTSASHRENANSSAHTAENIYEQLTQLLASKVVAEGPFCVTLSVDERGILCFLPRAVARASILLPAADLEKSPFGIGKLGDKNYLVYTPILKKINNEAELHASLAFVDLCKLIAAYNSARTRVIETARVENQQKQQKETQDGFNAFKSQLLSKPDRVFHQ